MGDVGIAIPPSRSTLPGRKRNPDTRAGKIRALKVGQSAWFPTRQSIIGAAGHAIANARDAPAGLTFVTRSEGAGTRIWRAA